MRRRTPLAFALSASPASLASAATVAALGLAAVLGTAGCGGSSTQAHAEPPKPSARLIFEETAPSVVAILNDDRADREQEILDAEKTLGDESHAPKHVIDVSLRKEPTPHGTGFAILDPQTHQLEIVTAAHVVLRPDRLKLTSRSGQTVDGEVVRVDDVRDVAILRPKQPLKDVPPLDLADADPEVGTPVWAMGHTGQGFWALSWGMSEGIASGTVQMFGEKLLLFDAAVYPGFSGGPVVALAPDGKPRVVGVNHAILFTGQSLFTVFGPISSAVSVSEVRETALGHPAAVEAALAAYAKDQRAREWADVFVTDHLSVARDAEDQPTAAIYGNAKSIEVGDDDHVHIPAVAMLFGLPKGSHDVTFEVRDPNETVLASETTTVKVGDKQRVAFASSSMQFLAARSHGKHAVVAKLGDKELGRSFVNVMLPDDDDDLEDDHDSDATDDGNPDVDVVVAAAGHDDPLAMMGIRAAWAERTYPRRVEYTWFARATRGWSGTNVSITSYVLDEQGHIVGRNEGCFQNEVRPEHSWACMGSGGGSPFPLASGEGPYDIVFAINDRPVAWWPMEAIIQQQHAPGSDLQRWMKEMHRAVIKRRQTTPATPAPPPAPAAAPKPGAKKK
ncbi:MAG TPA: serine protease [Polyangiaceae bacterium]|jgi:S1-C subfamily serine protease